MKMIRSLAPAELGVLVEALYATLQDHGAWNSVMTLLCQYLSADSATIRFYAPRWSEVTFSATQGLDQSFDARYREYFVHIDPIASAIDELRLPSGTMALRDDVIPFERLRRAEFYNDYMRPQDKRHVMGGYVYQEGGAKALFGVQRGGSGRAFRTQDTQWLELLAPHFQQVLRLHQAFTAAKVVAGAMNQALERLNIAAFFLDKTARMVFANTRAETLLRAEHLVGLRQGRLHAARRESDLSLQTLIEAATHRSSTAVHGGGAVRLATVNMTSGAVTAIVTPWRRSLAFGTTTAPSIVAAVFVGTCDRPSLRAQYLVGEYGLTRAEAPLAAKLVETCNLEQSAHAIGVAKQTGRDYLKSIFRKTDCHSQAELIGIILSSPSGLWGRETDLFENADPARRPVGRRCGPTRTKQIAPAP